MSNTWLQLLGNLPLSRTEREVVRRFEGDPEGRTFLPVADILRTHRLHDESLELLVQGVDRHPGFSVARVVLARELLAKGAVTEAWRTLEESPVPLRDNLLAQKLRFKLALLLGDVGTARGVLHHMKAQQMLDTELKRLGDLFEVSGADVARARLVEEFGNRGVALSMPVPAPAAAPVGDGRSAAAGAPVPAVPMEPPATTASAFYQDDHIEDDPAIQGFHVVALEEIFRPGDSAAPAGKTRRDGIELDSTTLAEIYERQGHYAKALEVYRRLMKMSPHNDLLRRKVAELARLDREQRDVDLTVDPAVVDRMETVEIIDRQIRFFNDILTRLG